MSKSSRIVSAALAVLLVPVAATFAGLPVPIAISGNAAPATGGGTYNVFANPVINSNGQVAFNASVSNGTAGSGIFTGSAYNSLQAIAVQGGLAPNGETFGTLFSSSTTETSTINSSGQLAFIAPVTGATPTSGIFTGTTSATLQTVALNTTAAPSGGNFNVFSATGINTASSPTLNASGQIAFASTLTGGTPSPGAGEFFGPVGSLQTVALLGGTAPGGGTYATAMTAPVVNGNGQIGFVSLLGASTPQAIFFGAPGSLQIVMQQGTTAPGTGGQAYGTPGSAFGINNAGKVAFISSLTVGSSTSLTPSTSGIFLGAPGAVQPVAINNTLAAGGSGGTYGSFSNVTINSAGRVAFGSTLNGGTAATGVFVGTNSSVTAVALVGGNSPVSGVTYAAFLSGEVQNGAGQVAFVASLAGPSVITGTDDAALIGGLPGALTVIVRKGDVIDVDPTAATDLRTVGGISNPFGLLLNAGGQDGKGTMFNDSGVLAYRLTFTDGSTGVFTSLVPEPTSLVALAAGAGLLIRRNSRRAR